MINGRHLGILAERYLDIVLADKGNTLLLLLQSPIIAVCIILVWRDYDTPTDSLYFVLALSAVWFGAINACREIVKERPIFQREARVGLDVNAYVASKLSVLALLGFIQCLLLIFMVDRWVPLPGATIVHFFFLFLASLAGTALGLAVSALAPSSDRAVAMVPIVLLPQILFSEMVVSHEHSSQTIKWLENLTITTWTYEGLKEVTATEWSLWSLAQCTLALLAMTAVLMALCLVLVRASRLRR